MSASAPTPAIEIACASRLDYLPHAATMLASALENAGAPVRAHLLVGPDVTADRLEAMHGFVEEAGGRLTVHRIDPTRFGGFGTTSTLPLAHWYRTLLPELLPELGRVLYLDSDLLVLRPLTELWDMDLEGYALAAATNAFPDPESGAAYCRGLGIEPSAYFNSGVMLLDLEELRAIRSFERIAEFARAHGDRLILPEQDATVAVLGDLRLPLGGRWNTMVADGAEGASGKPAILHFEGSRNKPWQDHAPPEVRRRWAGYRARTPWAHDSAGGEGVAAG